MLKFYGVKLITDELRPYTSLSANRCWNVNTDSFGSILFIKVYFYRCLIIDLCLINGYEVWIIVEMSSLSPLLKISLVNRSYILISSLYYNLLSLGEFLSSPWILKILAFSASFLRTRLCRFIGGYGGYLFPARASLFIFLVCRA